MLAPGQILGPGTVEDLITDARLLGHKATQRMIMDWQTLGLLDYPESQGGAGRGKGSKKALYSANQRKLFRTLIMKRHEAKRMSDLATMPAYLWLYWGDEYVPLRQLRLALKTFAQRMLKRSLSDSQQLAKELVEQLAHPHSLETDRAKLTRLISDANHRGSGVSDELEFALECVFDPDDEGLSLGPPAAPISVSVIVKNALARACGAAAASAANDAVPDDVFEHVRSELVAIMRGYLAQQPELAATAGNLSHLYGAPSDQMIVTDSCSHIITALGLELINRESGTDD